MRNGEELDDQVEQALNDPEAMLAIAISGKPSSYGGDVWEGLSALQ